MNICSFSTRTLDHSLRVRHVQAFAKVLLVEPHGGDDAARRPVDHYVSQQVIQGELPARQTDRQTDRQTHTHTHAQRLQ